MPRRSVVILSVFVVLAVLAGVVAPPAGASDDPSVVRYRPPVDGPIVDRFAPPAQRWQAGNRGIDYDVPAGAPVGAAADGEVVFAGSVAETLHVTIRHADGLRTSYSFLAATTVHVGQKVRAGQQVGVAGGPVHVGVRTPDGTYLDPEALFAGALEPRVRLVPGAEDGLDPLAERRSLFETLLDTGAAAVAHIQAHAGDWLELAAHYANELSPVVHAQRATAALRDWWKQTLDCTPASTPPPPPRERRIVVLVSGLGTDSGGNSAWNVDTDTLGYAAADVVRFSYQGGQAPPAEPDDPGPRARADATGEAALVAHDRGLDDIPVHGFTKADSQQSVELSGERLAGLLSQVALAEPGVPIDVIAHSQGGVVARLGVVGAGEQGTLPPTVENLVTVGSPHQGTPLATGVDALEQSPTGRAALDKLREGISTELDNRLPAMTDLSETSDLIARMRSTPIPDGVRFTSIGASGDVVVPGTATDDPQADTHRLIPTRFGKAPHGDLTEMPATLREIRLAVAGAGPTCQSFGEAMLAFAQAEMIRTGESALAADAAALGVASEPFRLALEPTGALDD